jgi:hypothetical protein
MSAEATSLKHRYFAWLSPFRVASAGMVVVAFLLLLPIYIPAPGDHETTSCGNALALDLGPWQGMLDGKDYFDQAHRTCTRKRDDRLAGAIGVLSLTVLAVTATAARTNRRRTQSIE